MRTACCNTLVGRSIPLEQVLGRPGGLWPELYYSREYRANLVTWLAFVGHLDACFKTGMSEVFMEGRDTATGPDAEARHPFWA